MTSTKQSWFKQHPVLIGIIMVIIALYLYENWQERNCNLTYETGAYAPGCLEACFVKCSNEGFISSLASYFKDIEDLYSSDYVGKICIYECEGCRK